MVLISYWVSLGLFVNILLDVVNVLKIIVIVSKCRWLISCYGVILKNINDLGWFKLLDL